MKSEQHFNAQHLKIIHLKPQNERMKIYIFESRVDSWQYLALFHLDCAVGRYLWKNSKKKVLIIVIVTYSRKSTCAHNRSWVSDGNKTFSCSWYEWRSYACMNESLSPTMGDIFEMKLCMNCKQRRERERHLRFICS